MTTVVLPNGQSYDLSTYAGRQAARDANPAYVVDDTGYLLRGTGGPIAGTANPGIQGGLGTASPNGATPGQNIGPSGSVWNQILQMAQSNTIPSGVSGSYLYPIAMMVSAGHSIDEAVSRVLNTATNAASDGGTDPANAANAAAGAGAKATIPQSAHPAFTASPLGSVSPHTLYIAGGAALVLLLLKSRR